MQENIISTGKPSRLFRKSLTTRDYSSPNKVIKFNYIWQSSIPESWDRIIKKKNIQKLQLRKKSRDTLSFLEETQKYISKICMPEIKEKEFSPPNPESNLKKAKRNSIISNKSEASLLLPKTKLNTLATIKSNLMKNRLVLKLKEAKSQVTSPIHVNKLSASQSLPQIKRNNFKK